MKVQISPLAQEVLSDPKAREQIYESLVMPRAKKDGDRSPQVVKVTVNGKDYEVEQVPALGHK